MSTRVELETVARQWVSLWCAPVDWQLFDRLHAEEFEDGSAAGRPPTKQGFARGLAELVRAFPDLRTEVADLVVDEARSQVAVRWSARGTNRAELLGVGPTGRLTPLTGIEIIEVRGGRVVRRWGEWDATAHAPGGGAAAAADPELVRRFYEEVVNTGDTSRMADFIAPGCVETDGQVRVVSGVEGMAQHVRGVRAVYPDLELTIERQISEGEWVVTLITARGTHAGEWLGMKPTGRRLTFTGVNVDRVQGGRIVEHGGAANLLQPFLEAGALRVVGSEGGDGE